MSRRSHNRRLALALALGAMAQEVHAEPAALTDGQLDQVSAGAFLSYNPLTGNSIGDPPLTLYGANGARYTSADGGLTYAEATTADGGLTYTPVSTVWNSEILYFFNSGLVYGVLRSPVPGQTAIFQYWDGGYLPPAGVPPYQMAPLGMIGRLVAPAI